MPHMKQIERTERNIPSGINRGNNREREREREKDYITTELFEQEQPERVKICD